MKKNRIRTIGSVIGGVAVLGLLSAVVWGIPALIDANRVAQVTPATVSEPAPVYLIPDYRHPTPTPDPVPVVEVAPAPEPEPVAPSITYCPSGTVAGAVDEAGNESNCYTLNDEGQQCVAYDDANNCTQWYKP